MATSTSVLFPSAAQPDEWQHAAASYPCLARTYSRSNGTTKPPPRFASFTFRSSFGVHPFLSLTTSAAMLPFWVVYTPLASGNGYLALISSTLATQAMIRFTPALIASNSASVLSGSLSRR